MKKDFFVFTIGLMLGYLLVQGVAFVQNNYLWAIFYH